MRLVLSGRHAAVSGVVVERPIRWKEIRAVEWDHFLLRHLLHSLLLFALLASSEGGHMRGQPLSVACISSLKLSVYNLKQVAIKW